MQSFGTINIPTDIFEQMCNCILLKLFTLFFNRQHPPPHMMVKTKKKYGWVIIEKNKSEKIIVYNLLGNTNTLNTGFSTQAHYEWWLTI